MKKNPFKVGDRVAVYGKTGNFLPIRGTGIIASIEHDELVTLDSRHPENQSLHGDYDSHTGGWDLTLVHWTQCRRLKKKSVKEWWISANKYVSQNLDGGIVRTSKPMHPELWIHVREVKKK